MEVISFELPDIRMLVPSKLCDHRGYFSETFRSDIFSRSCGNHKFVQDNESLSVREGTIRGLHFQIPPYDQGKLVRCLAGSLYDVVVDIRAGSATWGRWAGEELTPGNGRQMWVPPGFAHGFCTLAPNTIIAYKVTKYYSSEHDKGLAWDDPAVGVKWPAVADPETLSAKDRRQPYLSDISKYFDRSE